MRSRSIETVAQTPDSQMCLEDYFGEEYSYDGIKDNSIFKAFNEQSKLLNEVCRRVCLDIGEAQMMYGRRWTRLKYYEFDRVKEWIKNNYRKKLQILNTPMHNACMNFSDYKKWFERGYE